MMNTSRGPIYGAQLQRLGKYRLQERVGGSGIAEVWKAFSPQLRRYVAIKIFHADLKNDPRFISRFEREAMAFASLHHPNIVQIHDFQALPFEPADSNTIGYLVMDYIDGSTLADYISNTSRKKNFPPANEIVHLFASICAAIDYTHSKGIVHGAIKPANILLATHLDGKATNGHARTMSGDLRAEMLIDSLAPAQSHWIDTVMPNLKGITGPAIRTPIVTDFGITRLLGTPAGTLSRWGLLTPFYLSPKQAMGYAGDVSSDIYSLGVILYEICTGVPPFQGDNPSVIMMQHITATPTPPLQLNPDISPALSTIILRSLDKNPKLRFSSASAMAVALAEVLGVPIPGILSTPPPSERQVIASISSWQRPSTAPGWPPPPTPPSTPAFPSAPTPSLLRLALERLGMNPSFKRRTAQSGVTQGAPQRSVLRDSHLVLLAILILSLIASSLGALLVLAHQNPPLTTQQVGYAYFLSSGQLYENNNQGINDEVQIDLHGIAAPHHGKSYYAWLLGDENASEVPWMLLGKVSEKQGNVHFLYIGDTAHTNLLTDMSRFVITEEDANTTPNNPLVDLSTWRYYGAIFQTPSPKDVDHFSMLDHIRHLLVQAPELQALGLQGGLSTWLMQNVEEIAQWASNANEAWATKNTALMSRELINILYYIDGECTSADFAGMPSDMPTTPENGMMARIAHFSLINPCVQEQQEQANQLKQVFSHTPHDYIDHTLFHLAGVMQSPGATPAVRVLAVQLNTAVNNVKSWLEQVRKDALQLCRTLYDHLTQLPALSVLSDMEVQARYAYAGQTDPSTAQVQEGATWIYDNMQRLASIDVTSYPPQ